LRPASTKAPDLDAGYHETVVEAVALVLAHLEASPEDVALNRERHAEGSSLYGAIAAEFPQLERMRLTLVMWDQAVELAMTQLDHSPSGEGFTRFSFDTTLESVIDSVSGQALRDALAAPLEDWPAFLDDHTQAIEDGVNVLWA
jgi:hypothetical protein